MHGDDPGAQGGAVNRVVKLMRKPKLWAALLAVAAAAGMAISPELREALLQLAAVLAE